MHQIYSYGGKAPRIHPSAYIHPLACLIGDVEVGEGCFVAPGAVLRGDNGAIVMREFSNLQDNAVIHSAPGGATILGAFSQVGHGAVIHGCQIHENCLIGMNSVILDKAVLGRDSMVGAGALVGGGMVVEPGTLVAGTPAKLIKRLSPEAIAKNLQASKRYVHFASSYPAGLRQVSLASCLLEEDPEQIEVFARTICFD